uniref:Uncharacterized protein n=1 Tax=Arundo donax TaxID=35708 RepID=A0A0A9F2W9_ARUDO
MSHNGHFWGCSYIYPLPPLLGGCRCFSL